LVLGKYRRGCSDEPGCVLLVSRERFRDGGAPDGKFYYSVKTTGVYCLPSCPARPALRKNVTFQDTPEDAEKAGFRACKRCWPKGPTLAEGHAAAVKKACRVIETAEEQPTLDALAKTVGMSSYYFHRVFKANTDLTPKDYAVAHRSQRVREKLSKSSTVTEAIYGAGFNSNGRFYAKSSQTLGMTPTQFRNGGTGTAIRFAVGECSLGSVLVAVSERGVCAARFSPTFPASPTPGTRSWEST
jgi:AraC family transcriptional regulator of adaptative response/methylated-DNA-[protein]-cysteine methyltransferase